MFKDIQFECNQGDKTLLQTMFERLDYSAFEDSERGLLDYIGDDFLGYLEEDEELLDSYASIYIDYQIESEYFETFKAILEYGFNYSDYTNEQADFMDSLVQKFLNEIKKG